ncbi:MAG: hypothetical protein ACRDBQ_18715 [Shewanella sp.]
MRIRFSPMWEVQPNIDKVATSKKIEELQILFFNWLYDCHPKPFSSKLLPVTDKLTLFKSFMVQPDKPSSYYDRVLEMVAERVDVSLSDLYGGPVDGPLSWAFAHDGENIVASLVEPRNANGFYVEDNVEAKKKFCAELFKYMRAKMRVVDDTFSTSTQFANNELLTQLYACHLFNQGIRK